MDATWDNTKSSLGRLESKITWTDGRPYFGDRPVIHRDSPIDGGVYLGKKQREAIVVDSEKYPKLKEMYRTALERLEKKRYENNTGETALSEQDILSTVFYIVRETMPPRENNAAELDRLLDEHNVNDDKKIALDTFLNHGVGVCRHNSLACGALLELFKKDGHLNGNISVDRNSTYMGGHGWCRYTDQKGDVWILDISLGYLGKLKDSPKEERYAYERPELM